MKKIKTKHHLIPRTRRSDYKKKKILDVNRTLKLWDDRHKSWHHLFGVMTLQEIIMTLHRVHRIKFDQEFVTKSETFYY